MLKIILTTYAIALFIFFSGLASEIGSDPVFSFPIAAGITYLAHLIIKAIVWPKAETNE